MKIKPFTIHVPQSEIDALSLLLANKRWAPELDIENWSYGGAQEAWINDFLQFCAEIDGVPIHFIHMRNKGPNPVPIIINHGWPWTFWDFKDIIMALADPAAHDGNPEDAFDVVVLSLSGPMPRNCVGYVETASMWFKLMRELGYEKFITHGGDAAAFLSARFGHAHAELVMGVYLSLPILPGVPHDAANPADFTLEEHALVEGQERDPGAFLHVLITTFDPQTLPGRCTTALLASRRGYFFATAHGAIAKET